MLCVLDSSIVVPRSGRPTEGEVMVDVNASSHACPHLEVCTNTNILLSLSKSLCFVFVKLTERSNLSFQLSRMLERTLGEGEVLDKESLCILSGRKVWRLRVNVHLLAHDGNVEDAMFLAVVRFRFLFFSYSFFMPLPSSACYTNDRWVP